MLLHLAAAAAPGRLCDWPKELRLSSFTYIALVHSALVQVQQPGNRTYSKPSPCS